MKCKFFIIIICALAFSNLKTNAQQMKEQRVYLWDVSESLGNNGNNLWESLQDNLIEAIEAIPINPMNKIVLIPFYSNPQTQIEEYATEEGKIN